MILAMIIALIILWATVGLFATIILLMLVDAIVSNKTGKGLPIFKHAIWNATLRKPKKEPK